MEYEHGQDIYFLTASDNLCLYLKKKKKCKVTDNLSFPNTFFPLNHINVQIREKKTTKIRTDAVNKLQMKFTQE